MQSRLGSPGWLTVTVLTEIIIMTVMAIMLKWSSGKVIRMITGGNGHEKP